MATSKADLALFSSVASAAGLDLCGEWENELGSTLTITDQTDGVLTGNYVSAVSSNGGPVEGTFAGTFAKDTIGFTVNWQPTYDSVTSWVGKIFVDRKTKKRLHIYTLWQLSHAVESEEQWWQSIVAGSDMFRKIK